MTVQLTSNFLSKARGITLKDSAQVTWAINKNTNEITASAAGALGGTVTSVGLADTSTTPIYVVTGSPVTGAGTIDFALATQPANDVFAGPTSGGAAQPTFRALVAADIPTIPYTQVSGLATVAHTGAYSDLTGTPSIPVSANPTAKVALSAVNGVASTFMTSDSAPALDVTIAPVWSGVHKFRSAGTGVFVSTNTSVSPGTGGANLYVSKADGSGALIIEDSAAAASLLYLRRVQNTIASPQALASGNVIGTLGFIGYGATGFSAAPRAQINGTATEAWSDTAQGAKLAFAVTLSGGIVTTTAMTLENDGGLFMAGATGSSEGAGTINATGLYINGVPVITDSTMAWLAA